jgi:hypothetical protein
VTNAERLAFFLRALTPKQFTNLRYHMRRRTGVCIGPSTYALYADGRGGG